MNCSKIRWAFASLFPANNNSSIRCPSLLNFDLAEVAPVGAERVVGFFAGLVVHRGGLTAASASAAPAAWG